MRASPLLPCFEHTDFEFGQCGETTVALTALGATPAATFVADLSGLRKWLVIGHGAAAFLGSHACPAPVWGALATRDDGCWVARTGAARYLLSEGIQAAGVLELAPGRWAEDTLVLAHDSAEIALGGTQAREVLSEFCAIDLSQCMPGRWFPLLCAQVEIGCYVPAAAPDSFHLVCAPADASALFQGLREALRDCGGAIIGFADYQSKISKGGIE